MLQAAPLARTLSAFNVQRSTFDVRCSMLCSTFTHTQGVVVGDASSPLIGHRVVPILGETKMRIRDKKTFEPIQIIFEYDSKNYTYYTVHETVLLQRYFRISRFKPRHIGEKAGIRTTALHQITSLGGIYRYTIFAFVKSDLC